MSDLPRVPEQLITLRSTYVLKGMLHRGFTTVRDTGGATKFLSDSLKEGLIEGPRLFQCGKALSQTGGHGDFMPGLSGGDGSSSSCCGGHSLSLGRTADGVPAVLKATREELKAGADFIKIMLGGGVASESDGIETVQYTEEEVRAVTKTAWQMGKKMVSLIHIVHLHCAVVGRGRTALRGKTEDQIRSVNGQNSRLPAGHRSCVYRRLDTPRNREWSNGNRTRQFVG